MWDKFILMLWGAHSIKPLYVYHPVDPFIWNYVQGSPAFLYDNKWKDKRGLGMRPVK